MTKYHGRRRTLDDVTFTCPPGTITGFLGPNGAGKSTTLRILGGFSRASSGRATFAGKTYAQLHNPARTVGYMLDASALHPGLTARETVGLHAEAVGVNPHEARDLLDQVGLSGAEKRRVGTFSLGMRQRLGIAVSLVGAPTTLILDEPYNGLDPQGVHWIRQLLKSFSGSGGTALLSSHLLNEVRESVDRLVLLDHGRVVAAGDLHDLLRGTDSVVRTDDATSFERALNKAGIDFDLRKDLAYVVQRGPQEVSRLMFDAGIRLTELSPAHSSIEDLYFSRTEDRK